MLHLRTYLRYTEKKILVKKEAEFRQLIKNNLEKQEEDVMYNISQNHIDES